MWFIMGQCFLNTSKRKEAVKVKLKQLLEGISYEALSLAGTLKLNKLIVLLK